METSGDLTRLKPPAGCSYVLITPARNEAKFIELTIQSVIRQTILPVKWVIVSDGSTDGTDGCGAEVRRRARLDRTGEKPARKGRHFAAKVDAFDVGICAG